MSTELLRPHRGGMILAFGILSLVVCGVLGPFAWVMGKADLAEMDGGRMDPDGRAITQAGYICGIIGTVLLCLGLVFFIIYLLVMALVFGAAVSEAG